LRRYRDFCDFEDGGRRHHGFSKIGNHDFLNSNILTNFYVIWYGDACWPPTADGLLKLRIFETKDGAGGHLENHRNRDIFATV